MSLNFENIGIPLAIIQGGKTTPILSLGESARTEHNNIILRDNENFQQVPNTTKEREIIYVVGQSGSGKSYYTAQYCLQYKAIYPKRPIYMFSSLSDDKGSMDLVKTLKRFNLNDDFLNDDDITTEELKESLCIFDDVDSLPKKLKGKIWGIMNSILQTGRHFKISAVITFHVATSGLDTRMILNECNSITFFPATLGGRSLHYLLDAYLGLDKNEVKKIKTLKSRWITVFKSYPKVIMSQKEAYIA
jgi:energy-coupling factor transporter ATP-binding protein EcfA2